jgi:hypothetical protein
MEALIIGARCEAMQGYRDRRETQSLLLGVIGGRAGASGSVPSINWDLGAGAIIDRSGIDPFSDCVATFRVDFGRVSHASQFFVGDLQSIEGRVPFGPQHSALARLGSPLKS